MQPCYQCQICKQVTANRPPEWCPVCGGHRIIFKQLTPSEAEMELEKV